MGQRSQIYVRYFENNNERTLVARDFGWNYGERMISRARYTLDWLKQNTSRGGGEYEKRLVNVINTNFDMLDSMISSDIVKESGELASTKDELKLDFFSYDNNDGMLFIDIAKDGTIKYCFTDDYGKLLNAEEYMAWDSEGWETSKYIEDEMKEACSKNIKHISENYTLMTETELNWFVSYEYNIPLEYCDEHGAFPGAKSCDYVAYAITSPYVNFVSYIMQKKDDETGTGLNLFTIKKGTHDEKVFRLRNNTEDFVRVFEAFRSGKFTREEADHQVWKLLNIGPSEV